MHVTGSTPRDPNKSLEGDNSNKTSLGTILVKLKAAGSKGELIEGSCWSWDCEKTGQKIVAKSYRDSNV